jgi:hypothetical protein
MPRATSPNDRRLEKSAGKYATRAQLTEAVKALNDQGWSHRLISLEVLVSQATVCRILNGDKKTYTNSSKSVKIVSAIEETPYMKLTRLWKPTRQFEEAAV